MDISKNQIIELFKLFLTSSQSRYEEVTECISIADEQFLNLEFDVIVDENTKKIRDNGISLGRSYFRKKKAPSVEDLRNRLDFQAIAIKWQKATEAFNTFDALEQFCIGVAAEHQASYGFLSPPCQSFLEKFASGLLEAVLKGLYPIHCLIFLKDLWVDASSKIPEPFQSWKEAIPAITIRRPTAEDYIKHMDWQKPLVEDITQHLQIRIGQQTALIEFFWYDKQPVKFGPRALSPSIEFQRFKQFIDILLLLIGGTSVRMTECRYGFHWSGGPLSIFDSSPGRCRTISSLEKKLPAVGQIMLPFLMEDSKRDSIVDCALKYYRDSLFRSLGMDSRIALSISGLECLYLCDQDSKTEIALRLSLRVARLLAHLGLDPLIVKKTISKAYGIRSSHVHGSVMEKNDVQKMKETQNLSETVDEYLRLSILTFQYCLNAGHPPAATVGELHNSCFSTRMSEDLERCLGDIKDIVFS